MTEFYLKLTAAIGILLVPAVYLLFGISTVSIQRGYEGVGMDHVYNKQVLGEIAMANEAPVALPAPDMEGERSAKAYKNVKVLGGVSTGQFNRIMISMTQWVSPEQGCNYCHNPANMASDEKYTKHVARRMLQMTQYINSEWKTHVAQTGVTCWTCHRGNPVPKYIWFNEKRNKYAYRMLGNPAQQNIAGENVTLASLPNDIFTPFLEKDSNIRVIGKRPLPWLGSEANRSSIKQAEWTYGLMIHMSNALGVNCTYCHNSRSFAEWKQSPPARSTAWYGIRMVRAINDEYTKPLLEYYPDYRKGKDFGDAPKANCMTCHQGAYKPVLGAQMAKDFPSLQAPTPYVPPPDTDGDGLLDKDDPCPNDPETINFFKDEDGCSDSLPEGLGGMVGTMDGIEFVRDTAGLPSSSRRVLRAAVSVLKIYPNIKVEVRVYSGLEDKEAAKAKAQERAEAVRRYMVGRGLDGERVTAVGIDSMKEGAEVDGTTPDSLVEFYLD